MKYILIQATSKAMFKRYRESHQYKLSHSKINFQIFQSKYFDSQGEVSGSGAILAFTFYDPIFSSIHVNRTGVKLKNLEIM